MVNAKLISFVARSKRRKEVLGILNKFKEISQPEIMRISKQYKSHNARTLKELSEKKLIICINPEDRVFKFYKITNKGKEILKEANKISNNAF
jgi:DNA-binding MarR family transcriptional regulator